jgi:UPF0716 family protein affecting phage T7 exclusion
VTDAEPSPLLGHRCRVCGGPRVPVDDPGVVRSGREIPVLQRVQRERMRAAAWRTGGGVVLGFGVLSLLVTSFTLLLVSPGVFGTLLGLTLVAIPFALGVLAWRRGSKHRAELASQLRQARALVASDVVSSRHGEVTADELAHILRLSNTEAEQLLAELSVHDFLHARVTDSGSIAYSVRPSRMRVSSPEDAAAEMELEAELGAGPTLPTARREP